MKSLIIAICCLSSPALLFGQEKLNKLSAPTSPAAGILGVQSTAILAPKSYQSLEATIYSNFLNSEKQLTIPNDFSLEFTPYWTKNHGLSLDQFLYANFDEQIKRNSSFSIASTQKFLLGDSTATNGLAFGYRTTLYFRNKTDSKLVKSYKDTLNNLQNIRPDILSIANDLLAKDTIRTNKEFLNSVRAPIIAVFIKYSEYIKVSNIKKFVEKIIDEANDLPTLTEKNHHVFANAFLQLFDSKIIERDALYAINTFTTYLDERQGWTIDFAYAGIVNFPTNNFNFSAVPRQSLWITPTYRFKDNLSHLKILSVFRYEWYNLSYWQKYFPNNQVYKNSFDYGIGIAGEFQKVSIQLEAVGRKSNTEITVGKDSQGYMLYRKEQNSDFQCVGSFSYNVSDQIVLTYSFGNKFEPIQNPNNTLVSQLTLNFGFGTPVQIIKGKE